MISKFRTTALLLSLAALTLAPPARAQQASAQAAADVSDLPLIELPSAGPPGRAFAIMLTGDGGFASLDKQVSEELVVHGIPVVAFNTRTYLKRRRTPDESGSAMIRVLRHYLTGWSKDHVVLLGYSRGADMLPFIVSRLPADLRAKVSLVAMLGLSKEVNFQFHFKDIFLDERRPTDVKTLPELERLRGMNLLCIYGVDEKDSACRDAPPGLVREVARRGGHHFDENFKAIGDIVLEAVPQK